MRALALLLLSLLALPAAAQPIFDAHLHYNEEARQPFPLERVIELFRRNQVSGILANSRPNDGSRALLEARAPGLWVVAFVRPYRTRSDIGSWYRDPEIMALIEAELARGIYQGIGEFHLHGKDAAGAQVGRVVALAVVRDLWLHAHSDEAAIAELFVHDPRVKVIWAHTGFGAPAETVERLLRDHPTLMAELSYRSGIVGAEGKLSDEWRGLFERHPDRFLVGSDTWINQRWETYGELIAGYRAWLGQLPPAIAARIAHGNAERIFKRAD